jgi:hypothetical protein
VFDAIRELMTPPSKPKRRIGFESAKSSEKDRAYARACATATMKYRHRHRAIRSCCL